MPERYLGRTLGRFRVDAIIGSGGFAWVYKAYDPELEIPVALKVLKPQYAGDEKFEQRFRREASTAAKLRHPNIIKIYAVGREDEAVYFAMDYLPHGLADRLNVMTTLPESVLIRMGVDVASALGFAHREGVIHRDIKTDNILFDEHGNAIVADFGIARAVSGYAEQTGTNMVVGTPQYFSPEQARGLQLDGRADIYSLGVTMFKAATGQLPFQGTDWYEIARQHVEDKPPKPRSINPSVSRELEDVILQCLEKDPNDRFPSGEALCEELLRLLAERGETAAMRTSIMPAAETVSGAITSSRLRRRLRRTARRWWAGGAALSAALLGIVAYRGFHSDPASATPAAAAGRGAPAPRAGIGFATRPPPARPVARPEPRRLIVSATPGSVITVNGVSVGKGTWESDTLKPGRYQVRASIRSMEGCASTRDGVDTTLGETGRVEVVLQPRPCGTLALAAEPRNSWYRLRSRSGLKGRDGNLPLAEPLVLPVGAYTLTVGSRFCTPYVDEITIRPDRPVALKRKLICGKG